MIPSRSGHEKNGRRAFSLIEAAIILGIVGVILGGIWVVAGVVKKKAGGEQAYEEIKLIVDNMHSLGMGMSSLLYFGTGVDTDFTTKAFNAGLFPKNVLTAGALPTVNPWGGTIEVRTGVTSQSFRVNMYGIPDAECIQLFTRFLDLTDLLKVNIAGTWRSSNWIINNTGSLSCPLSGGKRVAGLEFTFRSQKP